MERQKIFILVAILGSALLLAGLTFFMEKVEADRFSCVVSGWSAGALFMGALVRLYDTSTL